MECRHRRETAAGRFPAFPSSRLSSSPVSSSRLISPFKGRSGAMESRHAGKRQKQRESRSLGFVWPLRPIISLSGCVALLLLLLISLSLLLHRPALAGEKTDLSDFLQKLEGMRTDLIKLSASTPAFTPDVDDLDKFFDLEYELYEMRRLSNTRETALTKYLAERKVKLKHGVNQLSEHLHPHQWKILNSLEAERERLQKEVPQERQPRIDDVLETVTGMKNDLNKLSDLKIGPVPECFEDIGTLQMLQEVTHTEDDIRRLSMNWSKLSLEVFKKFNKRAERQLQIDDFIDTFEVVVKEGASLWEDFYTLSYGISFTTPFRSIRDDAYRISRACSEIIHSLTEALESQFSLKLWTPGLNDQLLETAVTRHYDHLPRNWREVRQKYFKRDKIPPQHSKILNPIASMKKKVYELLSQVSDLKLDLSDVAEREKFNTIVDKARETREISLRLEVLIEQCSTFLSQGLSLLPSQIKTAASTTTTAPTTTTTPTTTTPPTTTAAKTTTATSTTTTARATTTTPTTTAAAAKNAWREAAAPETAAIRPTARSRIWNAIVQYARRYGTPKSSDEEKQRLLPPSNLNGDLQERPNPQPTAAFFAGTALLCAFISLATYAAVFSMHRKTGRVFNKHRSKKICRGQRGVFD